MNDRMLEVLAAYDTLLDRFYPASILALVVERLLVGLVTSRRFLLIDLFEYLYINALRLVRISRLCISRPKALLSSRMRRHSAQSLLSSFSTRDGATDLLQRR